MALNKGALDAWITREPEWEAELITQESETSIELSNEECKWCRELIGWHDIIDTVDIYWMGNYWQLDEDAEHCICVECKDKRDEADAESERRYEEAYAEYLRTKGEDE